MRTLIPTGRDFGLAEWINKIGVINDPLDQPHSEDCFVLFDSEMDGRTDM